MKSQRSRTRGRFGKKMSCCLGRGDQGCVLSRIPAAHTMSHSIQTFATQTAAWHDSLITFYSHLFATCWFPVSFPRSCPRPALGSPLLIPPATFPSSCWVQMDGPHSAGPWPAVEWLIIPAPCCAAPLKARRHKAHTQATANKYGWHEVTKLPKWWGWGEEGCWAAVGAWGWRMARTTNFISAFVFVSPCSPSSHLAYSVEHASLLIQMDTANAFSMRSW